MKVFVNLKDIIGFSVLIIAIGYIGIVYLIDKYKRK